MTAPFLMGAARIAASFDLAGLAASGRQATAVALTHGKDAAAAFARGFKEVGDKGQLKDTPLSRAVRRGFEDTERFAADSGRRVADSFIGGLDAIRSGNPGKSFEAATQGMTNIISTAGDAGRAITTFASHFDKIGPAAEMAGVAIGVTTEALALFTETGGKYLGMIAEIGDTYLELRRTLAASTLDLGQVNAQMAATQEIMASGAVDHFDDVSQSIARFARGLNLSGTELRDFTETYASMAELIGSISPTNIAGVLNAFEPTDAAARKVYDYSEQLTRFTNIIRATGGNAQSMVDSMIRVGPAMRALGFDSGGTALFFGGLLEKGLRGQKLVYGMNQIVEQMHKQVASGNFKDLESAFGSLLQTVKNLQEAGKGDTAIALLSEYTTPANATLLNEAISKGIIGDAEEMGRRAAKGFDQGLAEAAAETSSLSDVFENIQQQFEAAISPVGLAFNSFIVSGGSKLVDWLDQNQVLVAGWAKDIANFFLDGFQILIGGLGSFFQAFSTWVNPLVEVVVTGIQVIWNSIRLVFDGLGKLGSIIPDWLGGDKLTVFKSIADAMGKANEKLDEFRNMDLSKPFLNFGNFLENLNTKIGKVGPALEESVQEYADRLKVNAAFEVIPEKNKDGTPVLDSFGKQKMTEAFGPVPGYRTDPEGKIIKGADGNPIPTTAAEPMLQLTGRDNAVWEKVKANLRDLSIDITYDATTGIITNVNALTDEARKIWENWYQSKVKGQADVYTRPVNKKTGEELNPDSFASDLSGGEATVKIQVDDKYITDYVDSLGLSVPGVPAASGMGSGTLPSGISRPSILNDQEGVQSSPASVYAASAVAQNFPEITSIGGGRRSNTAKNTHDIGQAIDIAIPWVNGKLDMAVGDRINAYLHQNAEALNIRYTIWRDIGKYAGGKGKDFNQPGHQDHIDVQFNDGGVARITPSGTTITAPTSTPVPTLPSFATTAPGPVAPTGAMPQGGLQGWLAGRLAQSGFTPDLIRGILAMNQVEGGATLPESLLGFVEGQDLSDLGLKGQTATGLEGHLAGFLAQWNDMSRRPGGQIPGVSANGTVYDWDAFMTWLRVKIMGQNGVIDWQGNQQPRPEEYQARLMQALNGTAQPWTPSAWPGGVAPPGFAQTPGPPAPVAAPIPAAPAPVVPANVYPAAPAVPVAPGAPKPLTPAPPAGPGTATPPPAPPDGWKPDATGYYLYYQDARGTTFFADKSAGAIPVPRNGVPIDTDTGHWELRDHGVGGKKYWIFLPNPVSPGDTPAAGSAGGGVKPPAGPAKPPEPKKPEPAKVPAKPGEISSVGSFGTAGAPKPVVDERAERTKRAYDQRDRDMETLPGKIADVAKSFGAASSAVLRDQRAPEGEGGGFLDRVADSVGGWLSRKFHDLKVWVGTEDEQGRPTMTTRATGGPVFGSGTATSDSIPAWLSSGEFVHNAAAVQHYGMDFMHAINSRTLPRFGEGGEVDDWIEKNFPDQGYKEDNPLYKLLFGQYDTSFKMPAHGGGGQAGDTDKWIDAHFPDKGYKEDNPIWKFLFGRMTPSAQKGYNTGGAVDSPVNPLEIMTKGGKPDLQGWLRGKLADAGFSADQARGILAMNAVEGGDRDPMSLLGFTERQAKGPDGHFSAFLNQQWNDMSRRPGGRIPGMDDSGNVTDWAAYMGWIREKIVGQTGNPSDWEGNAQPPAADYQNRLMRALFGGAQRPMGFEGGGFIGDAVDADLKRWQVLPGGHGASGLGHEGAAPAMPQPDTNFLDFMGGQGEGGWREKVSRGVSNALSGSFWLNKLGVDTKTENWEKPRLYIPGLSEVKELITRVGTKDTSAYTDSGKFSFRDLVDFFQLPDALKEIGNIESDTSSLGSKGLSVLAMAGFVPGIGKLGKEISAAAEAAKAVNNFGGRAHGLIDIARQNPEFKPLPLPKGAMDPLKEIGVDSAIQDEIEFVARNVLGMSPQMPFRGFDARSLGTLNVPYAEASRNTGLITWDKGWLGVPFGPSEGVWSNLTGKMIKEGETGWGPTAGVLGGPGQITGHELGHILHDGDKVNRVSIEYALRNAFIAEHPELGLTPLKGLFETTATGGQAFARPIERAFREWAANYPAYAFMDDRISRNAIKQPSTNFAMEIHPYEAFAVAFEDVMANGFNASTQSRAIYEELRRSIAEREISRLPDLGAIGPKPDDLALPPSLRESISINRRMPIPGDPTANTPGNTERVRAILEKVKADRLAKEAADAAAKAAAKAAAEKSAKEAAAFADAVAARPEDVAGPGILRLPVDFLREFLPNGDARTSPIQTRALVDKIIKQGFTDPLKLVTTPYDSVLADGRKRLAAAQMLGLEDIPVRIDERARGAIGGRPIDMEYIDRVYAARQASAHAELIKSNKNLPPLPPGSEYRILPRAKFPGEEDQIMLWLGRDGAPAPGVVAFDEIVRQGKDPYINLGRGGSGWPFAGDNRVDAWMTVLNETALARDIYPQGKGRVGEIEYISAITTGYKLAARLLEEALTNPNSTDALKATGHSPILLPPGAAFAGRYGWEPKGIENFPYDFQAGPGAQYPPLPYVPRVDYGRNRLFPGWATGGEVWGEGTATSDSIAAWLSNGEFVHNAAAVDHYGKDFMHAVNQRKLPKFADGGDPSGAPTPSIFTPTGPNSAQVGGNGLPVDIQVLGDVRLGSGADSAIQAGIVPGTDPKDNPFLNPPKGTHDEVLKIVQQYVRWQESIYKEFQKAPQELAEQLRDYTDKFQAAAKEASDNNLALDKLLESQRNLQAAGGGDYNKLSSINEEINRARAAKTVSDNKLQQERDNLRNLQTSIATNAAAQENLLAEGIPKQEKKSKSSDGDKDAQKLGQGLVEGIFQGLGFPDVFGKSFTEWGAWKLGMGTLGYGMNLAQSAGLLPGPGTGPNDGLGAGTLPGILSGVAQSNLPGVKLPGANVPQVDPASSVTPAMAAAAPAANGPGPVGTGPLPGPVAQITLNQYGPSEAATQAGIDHGFARAGANVAQLAGGS